MEPTDDTPDNAPGIRTHSLREVTALGHDQHTKWECRGCGEHWPLATECEVIEQKPCGVRP